MLDSDDDEIKDHNQVKLAVIVVEGLRISNRSDYSDEDNE
jgi:hypothetical protein